jgi:nickel-type superoxide dismutase maturation protease
MCRRLAAVQMPLFRVVVDGESMRPAVAPGDRLLVLHARRLRCGDVVALFDPRRRDRTIVKRVAAIRGDEVTVLGDNPARSTDSRAFGPVHRRDVRGRAVYRYWPRERRGRLAR